jgi:Sodium/hydrogen exchanger family
MNLSPEVLLIILCGLIVLSYFFSILSRFIKVPSVLLLLFAGIGFRGIAQANHFNISIPGEIVDGLGAVGLIMIVLEAGLDLELSKAKGVLIRNSFFAALVILILSAALLTVILYNWVRGDILSCIVYSLPLSIMSSSIVLPSIHHLTKSKKEFLIYEASFSDIIGILLFNYFTNGEMFTLHSIGLFSLNIILSVILSVAVSFFLFLLMTKTKMNIKFFLVFAILVIIYEGGKMLYLPSLIIILVFGLIVNNWEKIPFKKFHQLFPHNQVVNTRQFMHSITAETSFLVRTFFFILFGFTMDLKFIGNPNIIWVGSLIVVALFLVRFLYLRFFFKTKIFPEVFMIPRGLVTIVLFYKIPGQMKLGSFDDHILFFIILATGIIMSVGMILYKKKNDEIIEDPQFTQQKEIL